MGLDCWRTEGPLFFTTLLTTFHINIYVFTFLMITFIPYFPLNLFLRILFIKFLYFSSHSKFQNMTDPNDCFQIFEFVWKNSQYSLWLLLFWAHLERVGKPLSVLLVYISIGNYKCRLFWYVGCLLRKPVSTSLLLIKYIVIITKKYVFCHFMYLYCRLYNIILLRVMTFFCWGSFQPFLVNELFHCWKWQIPHQLRPASLQGPLLWFMGLIYTFYTNIH